MIVLYDDPVHDELIEQAAFYAQFDQALAIRFLEACEATFDFLLINQKAGTIREFELLGSMEIRMWRVKWFEKHLVFYTSVQRGIKILHVVHAAADYNRVFEND